MPSEVAPGKVERSLAFPAWQKQKIPVPGQAADVNQVDSSAYQRIRILVTINRRSIDSSAEVANSAAREPDLCGRLAGHMRNWTVGSRKEG